MHKKMIFSIKCSYPIQSLGQKNAEGELTAKTMFLCNN